MSKITQTTPITQIAQTTQTTPATKTAIYINQDLAHV